MIKPKIYNHKNKLFKKMNKKMEKRMKELL